MKNTFVEHIISSFAKNIISCFNVFVHDVVEEFAEKSQPESNRRMPFPVLFTLFWVYNRISFYING